MRSRLRETFLHWNIGADEDEEDSDGDDPMSVLQSILGSTETGDSRKTISRSVSDQYV